MKFKPMLATNCDDIKSLNYPVYVTPKIDGIRCIIIDGVATSRSLKPIPNKWVQSWLGKKAFNGFDGELVIRHGTFQDTSSAVMSEDGVPDLCYCVFDIVDLESNYLERMEALRNWTENHPESCQYLLPIKCVSSDALSGLLEEYLRQGYEGVMVRSGDGPYKYGRSTKSEGFLLKVKPVEDAEAVIVDFEEQLHNGNAQKMTETGKMKRSGHKAGKSGKDTLGALVCVNNKLWPGQRFNVGSGLDDAIRLKVWRNKAKYRGKFIKFKYQKIGTKDKPRIPIFLGFRDSRDLDKTHPLL